MAAAITGLAAVAALTAGCGTAAPANGSVPKVVVPRVIVIRDNANGRAVSARTGDTVELILSSSYWKVVGNSAPQVLRQEGATALLSRPSTCPPLPGLGCTPVRTVFKAVAGGKAVIVARRSNCGEALRCSGRLATRFMVTVVVTSA